MQQKQRALFQLARAVPTTTWSAADPMTLRPRFKSVLFLLVGLWIFGMGHASLIVSGLGVSPWTTLAQGVSAHRVVYRSLRIGCGCSGSGDLDSLTRATRDGHDCEHHRGRNCDRRHYTNASTANRLRYGNGAEFTGYFSTGFWQCFVPHSQPLSGFAYRTFPCDSAAST